jgi:Rrf2 family protein
MKLSSLCGHALHALVYLARHEREGFVPAVAVADAEGLPRDFLTKGLRPLVSRGLLHALRGPNGGYRLARPARGITLLDVVEAVDGPIRGEAPRFAAGASRFDDRLRRVCDEAAAAVRRRLRQVSLADLAGGE